MSWIIILIGLFLIAIGFPLHWKLKRKAATILLWPKTQGVILEAGRYTYKSGTASAPSETTIFRIQYQYVVNGQTYQSKDNPGNGTMAELESRHVKGGPVEVQYNPQQPDQSRVGFTGKGVTMAILPWAIGATMVVAGLLMMHGEHATRH